MSRPQISKFGTIDCEMVETTPVVLAGRLYRFETVRREYRGNKTGDNYFRFVEVDTGRPTPGFAHGHHLGCAYVEGDTVWAFGPSGWGASQLDAFWSKDLTDWSSTTVFSMSGWSFYNSSVCHDGRRYVMALEVGDPPEEVGHRFTARFAESTDLRSWRLLPRECNWTIERYTGCPTLRFFGDWYYVVYLESLPGPRYETYVVRSHDLVRWQMSPFNPVLKASDEDRRIANPDLSDEQQKRIAVALDVNNSDFDCCDFQGRTVIYYSWGSQQGIEFLAEAVCDAPEEEFFRSFFDE